MKTVDDLKEAVRMLRKDNPKVAEHFGEEELQKLQKAGYRSVEDLRDATIQSLRIAGLDPARTDNLTAGGDLEEYNTSAPGYSSVLAEKLNMRSVYEQYGLYLTTLGGFGFAVNNFFKANQLMKAAHADDPKEAAVYRAYANVSKSQVENASILAQRFRTRGVAAMVGAPVFYLAWRSMVRSGQSLGSKKRRKE